MRSNMCSTRDPLSQGTLPASPRLQVSYTSWFLDAFNYAMATKMNIVNLSIGEGHDAPAACAAGPF